MPLTVPGVLTNFRHPLRPQGASWTSTLFEEQTSSWWPTSKSRAKPERNLWFLPHLRRLLLLRQWARKTDHLGKTWGWREDRRSQRLSRRIVSARVAREEIASLRLLEFRIGTASIRDELTTNLKSLINILKSWRLPESWSLCRSAEWQSRDFCRLSAIAQGGSPAWGAGWYRSSWEEASSDQGCLTWSFKSS